MIYGARRNRNRRRATAEAVALAIFALLLQVALPLPAPAEARSTPVDAHALCLAQTGGEAGPQTPAGKGPGSGGQSCGACCFGAGSFGALPAPTTNPERVAFAEPLIPFPATIGVARPRFAHPIRARAPPARA